MFWGRYGFDVGVEPESACRGCSKPCKTSANYLVANDDNYALAA